MAAGITLWTVGHSTRSLDELIAALQAHNIEALIYDVGETRLGGL